MTKSSPAGFSSARFAPCSASTAITTKLSIFFPTATQTILTNYDQLRYHLLPYIYSVSWMVTSQGYSMMRGLVMDFQSDTNVYDIASQYMFGPAIMVNPVTTAGATNRNIYLPAGTSWVNFWTGQTNAGRQTISTAAPIATVFAVCACWLNHSLWTFNPSRHTKCGSD